MHHATIHFFRRAVLRAGVLMTLSLAASIAPASPPPGDTTPRAISVPSTPVGVQLKWVLRLMNGEDDGADAASHFTDEFLADIPINTLKQEVKDIRSEVFENKQVRVVSGARGERDDTTTATINAKGTKRFLDVFIIVSNEGKIAGLRFEPSGGGGDGQTAGGGGGGEGGSWDDFGGDLDDMPGEISFGCYELMPRDPAKPSENLVLMPVAAKHEDRPLAIGSVFKLYVLGALAEDVAAGKASWDEMIEVRDEWKSLPSGRMQLLDAGTKVSIEGAASKMISISDNTAADHLIHRLGRTRVEAYTNAINDNTTRNTPFLTTREMFVLKLWPKEEEVEDYADSSDDAQRAMLETGLFAGAKPDLEAAGAWGKPRLIDSLEWFASARQCAQAFARLRELEQVDANKPLQEVTRQNPGLALDRTVWTRVAYKGGSEPGVLSMCWLLERDDGKWYVFCVTQNNREENINDEAFNRVCYQGLSVLADDGRKPRGEREQDAAANQTAKPTAKPAPKAPPAHDPFMDTGDEPLDPNAPRDDGT